MNTISRERRILNNTIDGYDPKISRTHKRKAKTSGWSKGK